MEKIIGFTTDNEIIVSDVSFERVGNNPEPDFSVSFNLSKITKSEDVLLEITLKMLDTFLTQSMYLIYVRSTIVLHQA